MNDNSPNIDKNIPEWAWDIVDQHDLGSRADCPLAATTVLVTDAAEMLREAAQAAFREQALSADTLRMMAACATMLGDALKLAPLCPTRPKVGVVTESKDGTLTWRAAQ